MELYLAKLLGLYFIIIGIVMISRKRAIIPAVAQLLGSRAIMFLVALIEIAAGIALILAYPNVELSLTGAFALIGYVLTVEGIIYLIAPRSFMRWFTGLFNRPSWYIFYAPIAIALGAFFAATGFGLI